MCAVGDDGVFFPLVGDDEWLRLEFLMSPEVLRRRRPLCDGLPRCRLPYFRYIGPDALGPEVPDPVEPVSKCLVPGLCVGPHPFDGVGSTRRVDHTPLGQKGFQVPRAQPPLFEKPLLGKF